ncbi:MAG TPA: hypothetical protein VEF72_17180, partial [Mycobacterium sp.]|nr:hypothetical protein [Mycobacterium sp.]
MAVPYRVVPGRHRQAPATRPTKSRALAGLGQVIVSSQRVPLRIRQSLNVEAGLNDGLAVPLLMLFIVLAVAEE